MKRVIMLCGPNGVGKTSICRALLRVTPRSAYVDSDPLRLMNPFVLNDETIPTIAKNLGDVIVNYLECPAVETVFFSYGLHGRRREVLERVLRRLEGVRVLPFVMECSEEENVRRMRADGRDEARIARALAFSRGVYADVPYPRVDVTALSAQEAAQEILRRIWAHTDAWRIVPMTQAYAEAIARWAYPEPYAACGAAPDGEMWADCMGGESVACVDADGAVCGYFCFGRGARIPTLSGDAYDESALDMAFGLRPDLCGHRHSGAFLGFGMRYAQETLGACALRVTAAGVNARAIRACEKVGFILQRKLWHAQSGAAYYVMRRDGGMLDAGTAAADRRG